MGPAALAQVLRPLSQTFDPAAYPRLLVGLSAADDAAVYQLTPELAVVQTVDFFAPVVDDPYTFGALAAVNAMSDIWAMGGEVTLALNIAAFPEDLPPEVISEVFRGGAEKVREAGGVVAGGHTVYDREPKFGLAVTGTVHPERIITKGGARPGDLLYLTKPLGSGLIVTAAKRDQAEPAALAEAIRVMLLLNRAAAGIAVACGVRSMTDITGFGLLGHLDEMARASAVGMTIRAGSLPLLPGAFAAARAGVTTGGAARNEQYAGGRVRFELGVGNDMQAVLWDPQTAGGLLIAVPAVADAEFSERCAAAGVPAVRIGRVGEGDGITVAE